MIVRLAIAAALLVATFILIFAPSEDPLERKEHT